MKAEKKKPNYYVQILKTLKEFKYTRPSIKMGQIISTALDEYPDVWGLSDKEILFALKKYKAELEYDVPHTENVEAIVADGMKIGKSSILDEEDEEEDDGESDY